MTLEEAIGHNKEVKRMVSQEAGMYHPEKAEAVQLGIEALKRELEQRDFALFGTFTLLPDETEAKK